jgi:CPA2 family monovalent cation:H+ antiporter-2
MLLKGSIVTVLVLPVIGSLRLALVVGACLSQVGELAIVLVGAARPYALLDPARADLLFAIAVLSFVASPLLVHPAERLGLSWQNRWGRSKEPVEEGDTELAGHVVVIGYGLNGRNLARVLRETGIVFRAIALDPRRVAEARRRGDPILYGDATRPDVLAAAAVERAAIIVIAISDQAATRRVTALARQMNPSGVILVRTRYLAEIDQLYRNGASEVIAEEFETSVEIFARVLHRLHIPRNVIDLQVELVRGEGYEMLRDVRLPRRTLRDVQDILAMALTETFLVEPTSAAAGKTIRELRLRSETGVTIIALVQDGTPRANPDPETRITAGDVLVLLGNHAELDRALARLSRR